MEVFSALLYYLLFAETTNTENYGRLTVKTGEKTIPNNDCETNRLTTFSWESASSVNSSQLLPAGKEGNFTYYVARMKVGDQWVNGKSLFIRNKHIAYIALLGKELESQEFQVLVAPPEAISWVEIKFEKLKHTWIVGGTDPISNECTFICRAFHGKWLIVGRGIRSTGICHVGIGNKIFGYKKYEILVINAYGRSINLQEAS